MHAADVFVSVPSSDGTSVALLQAMAAGCFPIVSDLPSQRELIDHGVNGLRVPLHNVRRAGERHRARARGRAAAAERRRAEPGDRRGARRERVEMAKMERTYLRLAGRTPA